MAGFSSGTCQKKRPACQAFFAANGSDDGKSGSYYLVWPETNDEAGYRKAYRSAYRDRASSKNHEKLFDAQPQYKVSEWGWSGFAMDCVRQGGGVPTNELMEMFGMADGKNFPYADIYGAGKNPTGIDMFENRDPRLYETIVVPREKCNAIEDYKGKTNIMTWVGGDFDYDSNMNSNADNCASGYMMFKWVNDYWKIGNEPIGLPYIRLAMALSTGAASIVSRTLRISLAKKSQRFQWINGTSSRTTPSTSCLRVRILRSA